MSDQTKSKGGWQPPEPVFRSTEGKTPRTAPGYIDPDDIDTQTPDFTEADTDEWDTEPAPIVESNPSGRKPDKPSASPPPASSGCFSTFLTMLSMATLFGLLIVAIAAYFLLYYTPRSTTF